jgi:hypothetical protein
MSSAKRSPRRNSCIIGGANKRESDYDDDPSSLLTRAKTNFNKTKRYSNLRNSEASDEEDNDLLYEEQSNTPTAIFNDFRKTPLTTPHAAPTEKNLMDTWGNLEIGYESSSPASSGKSYGASMYKESGIQIEIDKYKQKARRRASLEDTCVDMTKKGMELANFKPAEGCYNASDFVVRCFAVRLRTSGFTVLKHNKNRFSKAKYRILYLMPDGKTLTWRSEEGKDTGKRPKVDLTTCKEVRHAWSADPTTKKKTGTAVLRNRCKENLAGKSFSLIFAKRSLDFTAFSNDQCKVLMEGFSALCYRLQVEPDEYSIRTTSKEEFDTDDWESTVFGSTATPSVANAVINSQQPPALSPWGY